VSAANTTMMPCAKLNTPDALKISTKPERDEGIEHAGDETLPESLDQQVRRLDHDDEGVDEDVVEHVAAGEEAARSGRGDDDHERGEAERHGEALQRARVEGGLAGGNCC
jgi:hypothetical protein